jgi:hypothetical protein
MSRFFFFTDIDSVENQSAGDAFGPVSGSTDTRFRVTSIHRAAAGKTPGAYAVCDGLVCAQADDQGTLTMILKPSVQPPFDFPAISYILYKGIDPLSLLAADGTIDSAQESDSDLISAIKTAWELEANGNTGSPTRACVGLHLNPTDYPADDNPERFADTEPIDRFFYEGDPTIQLPLVQGGWRLGSFSTNLPFGIEIVVERIGRLPKIALARKLENIVEVDALANAADASEVFHHWDAKEAILDFVDPCAFWGSFFAAKLCALNSTNSEFDKLSGDAIYETVLRGTAAGAAKFVNRNRSYIDIRNEHGNSLNYYQADGPNIQLTLDADADIDTAEVNYYGGGWPSFALDNSNLPAGTTGHKIDVRFALPKTANTRPLIYISAGYRDKFRRLKDRRRFMDRPRRADVPYLEEASITIPIVADGGTKIVSCYQKIFSFKRPLIVGGSPVAGDPNSLAPPTQGSLDNVFPLLGEDQLPTSDRATVVRSFSDEFYVGVSKSQYEGFSARLTFAVDAHNYYLFLAPCSYFLRAGASAPFDAAGRSPSVELLAKDDFLSAYVAREQPDAVVRATITPPAASAPMDVVVKAAEHAGARRKRGGAFDQTIVVAFSKNEIAQLVSALQSDSPVAGSVFLTPAASSSFRFGPRRYTKSTVSISYLGGTTLTRKSQPTSLEIYADADL